VGSLPLKEPCEFAPRANLYPQVQRRVRWRSLEVPLSETPGGETGRPFDPPTIAATGQRCEGGHEGERTMHKGVACMNARIGKLLSERRRKALSPFNASIPLKTDASGAKRTLPPDPVGSAWKRRECPLLAQSRHWGDPGRMSAFGQSGHFGGKQQSRYSGRFSSDVAQQQGVSARLPCGTERWCVAG